MNALFIVDEPNLFEAESESRAQMREYASAIGTLHVLSPCAPSYKGSIDQQDGALFLHVMEVPRFFAARSLSERIHSLILENNIAIVSVHNPFEYALAALQAVKGTQAKLHIQIHTDFLSPWFTRSAISRSPQTRVSPRNRTRQKIADRVLPHADGIRVVSKRIQESVIARYNTTIQTPVLIPPECSTTLPPKVALLEHSFSFVLMTISRLEPEKRIEDILVALVQIKGMYPGVGLMIIGEGGERKHLEHWVEVLGLGDLVMFLGDRSDAIGLLQNANALVQASAYEGFGSVLIEAALARVPIVTTDVGIVGEVFKGYEDVLATPPGDPKNIGVHITELLEDVPARQQFIMHAEKTALAYLASVHSGPVEIANDLQNVLTRENRNSV